MITLKNITKIFSNEITALKDINLHVERGQIFGIIGKSGAGKSTLLRSVNLLERPHAGKVMVDGQNLLSLSPAELRQARKKIGMIFQNFNLLRTRTVYDNIALPLEIHHSKKENIAKTIMPLIEWLGLNDRVNAYPHQLSGGQKQRVAIARALATEPTLLLCDEMTSALDPQSTQNILNLIKEINTRLKLTILLITHEMEVIKRVCDKVAVIDNGCIVEQGDVFDVFCRPQHPVTRELTATAFNMKLPDALHHKVQQTVKEYALWKVSFIGAATGQPVISNLIREFNVEINILQADIELLHQHTVGMMLIAVHASQDTLTSALHYLAAVGLHIEVLGYVARDDWHFN